jgi:hypothetical protein
MAEQVSSHLERLAQLTEVRNKGGLTEYPFGFDKDKKADIVYYITLQSKVDFKELDFGESELEIEYMRELHQLLVSALLRSCPGSIVEHDMNALATQIDLRVAELNGK